jgi:hypothetical protein
MGRALLSNLLAGNSQEFNVSWFDLEINLVHVHHRSHE